MDAATACEFVAPFIPDPPHVVSRTTSDTDSRPLSLIRRHYAAAAAYESAVGRAHSAWERSYLVLPSQWMADPYGATEVVLVRGDAPPDEPGLWVRVAQAVYAEVEREIAAEVAL